MCLAQGHNTVPPSTTPGTRGKHSTTEPLPSSFTYIHTLTFACMGESLTFQKFQTLETHNLKLAESLQNIMCYWYKVVLRLYEIKSAIIICLIHHFDTDLL